MQKIKVYLLLLFIKLIGYGFDKFIGYGFDKFIGYGIDKTGFVRISFNKKRKFQQEKGIKYQSILDTNGMNINSIGQQITLYKVLIALLKMNIKSSLKESPASKYTPFLPPDIYTDKLGIQNARGYFPTNNVLINPEKQTIYLPAFLKLKFKNFTDLNIGGLSALLNGQIVVVIYYGQLFQVFRQKKIKQVQNCLMKKLVLLFARDNAIKLTNDQKDNDQKHMDIKASHDIQRHEVKFVIKKILNLYLDSDIILTPFQLINGILEITLQSVKLNYSYKGEQTKEWKIMFNLQNNWNIEEKVSFKNWGTFGNYDLAQKKIGALYTNYRISEAKDFTMTINERIKKQEDKNTSKKHLNKMNSQGEIQSITYLGRQNSFQETPYQSKENFMNASIHPLNEPDKSTINEFISNQTSQLIAPPKEQKQLKIQPFHYAYFNIPLYKYPFSTLITVFIPLFFLDILNFGILFQDRSMSDRIATIATLVLAFAALIPTIRSQIPPSPKITLIQVLVYLQSVPTILAIIQSLYVIDMFVQNGEDAFNYDWRNNGFFWLAFSVSLITFLIILGLVITHYTKWYPEYNDVDGGSMKIVFDRTRWRNTECNKYFDRYFHQKMDSQLNAVILTQKT